MDVGNLAELRIVSGHPALDLANTVAPRPPGTVELEFLSTPDDLLRWAPEIGIMRPAQVRRVERAWSRAPGAADAALADVLDLRALVDRTLAGRGLDRLS